MTYFAFSRNTKVNILHTITSNCNITFIFLIPYIYHGFNVGISLVVIKNQGTCI